MTRKTAVVVTAGARQESLGAMKAAAWLRTQGYDVSEQNTLDPMYDRFDKYFFSAVFSWRLPMLCDMARIALDHHGGEVEIGGPAVSFHPDNAKYVRSKTGVTPHVGLDDRFDGQIGTYPMVYFTRGCPAYTPACGTCPVPRLEGTSFKLYRDAIPAPMLLDNNLSALPDDWQDYIIGRYAKEWPAGKKVDANSGFEPHSFTEDTLRRWEKFPLTCWRFGYDDITERYPAIAMMDLLASRGHAGERVRVYTLVGNEPREVCERRIQDVIARGFHPWPQRLRQLNWVEGPLPVAHGWDEPTLIAFQRFYSIAGLWKRMRPEEFYYQGRYPLRPPASRSSRTSWPR